MSTVVCQKVTNGNQWMAEVMSGPSGLSSHSGLCSSRSVDHHTTGSEAFCRKTARGWPQTDAGRLRSSSGNWANRTFRPSSYSGRQTGLPASPWSRISCEIGAKLGVPTIRAPSVLASRFRTSPNDDSIANPPRLSPVTTSLGRWSFGRADHLASTAWTRARVACAARSLSTRKETQLGR
jgi:hypothetical protein